MENLAHIRRDLKACVALGATLVAFAAAETATAEPVAGINPGQAIERPAPTLKTGSYEGFTSQPCTAEAAAEGVCVKGEKIPLSFTATEGKIVDFKSAITTTCRAGAITVAKETFPLAFKQIKMDTGREFSKAQLKEPGTEQKAVTGTMGGTKALGGLGFSISINRQGTPTTDGPLYCQSDFIDFEAERVEQP